MSYEATNMPESWGAHWSKGPDDLAERFNVLDPEGALDLLETMGLQPVGDSVNHDSLENRVFSYTLSTSERVVLKVYRPGRWSLEGLQDEIDFTDELLAEGISVVRPLDLPSGGKLGTWEGMHFALFEFIEGTEDRSDPLSEPELRDLGRLAARIHRVGERKPANHRMPLEPLGMGGENLALLESGDMIPRDIMSGYSDVAQAIIDLAVTAFESVPLIRVHGDLGNWNLLWTNSGPVVMDLDDFAMAPAAQDLATLHAGLMTPWGNPGKDLAVRARLQPYFREGYREVRDLPEEYLRPQKHLLALRTIWFDAWVQFRLHDASFSERMKAGLSREKWSDRVEGLGRFLKDIKSGA